MIETDRIVNKRELATAVCIDQTIANMSTEINKLRKELSDALDRIKQLEWKP